MWGMTIVTSAPSAAESPFAAFWRVDLSIEKAMVAPEGWAVRAHGWCDARAGGARLKIVEDSASPGVGMTTGGKVFDALR
jgi:hypothetical protein